MSLPVTLIILLLAFGPGRRARAAAAGGSAVTAAIGLLGPLSQIWPVDESVTSVVLLVGLAVGVDYSMFYLSREREERARGHETDAALRRRQQPRGTRSCSPGHRGIAMAGMFFAGAPTFTSFATGTIMVVAIAVLGSLTVLPGGALEAWRRVNQGRIPFLSLRGARGPRSRVWSAILDRVLRHPVIAAPPRPRCCWCWRCPALNLNGDPGLESLPQTSPSMQAYDRIQAAFPGEPDPGRGRRRAPATSTRAERSRVLDLRERAQRTRAVRASLSPSTCSSDATSAWSTCRSPATGPTTPRGRAGRTARRTSSPRLGQARAARPTSPATPPARTTSTT